MLRYLSHCDCKLRRTRRPHANTSLLMHAAACAQARLPTSPPPRHAALGTLSAASPLHSSSSMSSSLRAASDNSPRVSLAESPSWAITSDMADAQKGCCSTSSRGGRSVGSRWSSCETRSRASSESLCQPGSVNLKSAPLMTRSSSSSSTLVLNGKQPQSITCKHIPRAHTSALAPYGGGASGRRGGEHSCQYQIVTSGAAYSGVPCKPVSVPTSSPTGTHAAQCRSATHTSYPDAASFLLTCTVSGFRLRSTAPQSCARLVASTSRVKMLRTSGSLRRPLRCSNESRSSQSSPVVGASSDTSMIRVGDCSTSDTQARRADFTSSDTCEGGSASCRCAAMAFVSSSHFPVLRSETRNSESAYVRPVRLSIARRLPACAPFSSSLSS
mmetsp:Transcript_62016/g.122575  ORF Transcript_62016/g.122575 Transcript_62016/m.122575 type:complete len:386 (+) Transcript_62016:272-1429(+)